MNTLTSVLSDYKQLAQRHGLAPMELATLTTRTEIQTTPQAVWAELQKFAPQQGWLGCQSSQQSFSGGQLPLLDAQADGVLLAAEVGNGQKSLHIRYDGIWRLTYYHQGEGESCLADTVQHIAHDPKRGKLVYRRFWHLEVERGVQPFAACFIGFES